MKTDYYFDIFVWFDFGVGDERYPHLAEIYAHEFDFCLN